MYKICPKIKNGIVADGSEKNQIALVFFFFLIVNYWWYAEHC